jgi:ATP-dependent Lon protease
MMNEKTLNETIQLTTPVIALKNKVLYPGELVSLVFEREISLNALNQAVKDDIEPVFVFQKQFEHEVDISNLYHIGTTGKIVRIWQMPEGPTGVLVEGQKRARISDIIHTEKNLLEAKYELLETVIRPDTKLQIEALMRNITAVFKEILSLGASVPLGTMNEIFSETIDPNRFSCLIGAVLNIKNAEKQQILEINDLQARLEKINVAIVKEKEILEVGQKVQKETQKQIGKFAREAMLREQMKAIEKELGASGEQSEYADLEKKIQDSGMPKDIEDKAIHELSRLEKMPPFSPESSYIQNYLETLSSLPWSHKSKVRINLEKAQKVLDNDHFGLKDVKERVLEYLAVEKLTKKPQGTILCFFGPPGTGKTSIGESIAEATGREFVKVSLGGVRDETEIRGHRRTYVGAMPGRIIQGLRGSKTSNPVFMLDEIDKLGSDFRGDPSAALLEVLDPAQNKEFHDHYLDVPYDLSDVIFITTANELGTIPEPLLDRMEVIEFTGYTDDEKVGICENYLVPRTLQKSGLKKSQLQFTKPALYSIIRKYTFEAGLRSLERELAKIGRKVAKEYLSTAKKKDFAIKITPKNVEKYLKGEKYEESLISETDEIGLVNGLGWTPHGGDVLFIETNVFKGDGQLTLTGQLGKVMQESAQAAYSYIKSNYKLFDIDPKEFKSKDLHVHVPAGAIPKDGPSAGLAIATSIISALSQKPVDREVAMTGEINLRGKALKIGGVKNKVLAAHRAGIKKVLLPKSNQQDAEEIPQNIKNDLEILFAENMQDIYKQAIKY